MVGHQTVGVDDVTVAAAVATQPSQIGPVVPIIGKGLAPLVATDDHMVEQAGGKQSGGGAP